MLTILLGIELPTLNAISSNLSQAHGLASAVSQAVGGNNNQNF
jgi:hypothetical protein